MGLAIGDDGASSARSYSCRAVSSDSVAVLGLTPVAIVDAFRAASAGLGAGTRCDLATNAMANARRQPTVTTVGVCLVLFDRCIEWSVHVGL